MKNIFQGDRAMIYDLIGNKNLYTQLGEKFVKAFEFIEKSVENGIETGKYFIDGDDVYANVSAYETKCEGVFEAHKKYIDLQFVLEGHEQIFWKNINDCKITKEYDAERDCMLLDTDEPVVLDMPAGTFAILFPDDVHAPGRAYKEVSSVKKIVVKIKVD